MNANDVMVVHLDGYGMDRMCVFHDPDVVVDGSPTFTARSGGRGRRYLAESPIPDGDGTKWEVFDLITGARYDGYTDGGQACEAMK